MELFLDLDATEEQFEAPFSYGSARDGYFMDHPDGRIEVLYEAGITAETLLETLPEGAVVARIHFMSSEGAGSVNFPLVNSNRHRVLEFKGEASFAFHAWTGRIDYGITN